MNVGEPRRVGGTVKRQVGPYDEAERARREAEAERERARARIAGLEQPLGRADEADVLRLGALALGSLAELVEEAAGLDARGPGTRAGNLLRRFAPTGRRLELELVHEEVVRELLGDTKRVAADHYVYALTDYREVDRTLALERLLAEVT